MAIRFACPAAIGSQTEKLPTGIMNVGKKKRMAAAAFAAVALGTHRPKRGKKTKPTHQQKSECQQRKRQKKEEKFLQRISKKIRKKNTQFQTGGFPPLSSRR
ncbi:MAG: hypothetical protein LC674_00775 [Actinobacteria bacterium]|nr:hypothetical protein [Actinomycetota bacterium]